MKKIIITENQLRKITESLLDESSDIMGLKIKVNDDGTVSFYKKDGQKINIRFSTRYGNVNITNIIEKDGSYYITTIRIKEPQEINQDGVKKLIEYINAQQTEPVKILWNIKIGDLIAKKV